MKTIRNLMFVVSCVAVAAVAQAQSWQFVGSRAMGMGGVGVATAYGPDAQYWNPAGLAQEDNLNETGLLINLGADIQATKNVLEGVSNLTDMADQYKSLENAINTNAVANAENISTLFKGLNDISKLIGANSGALVNANAGLGLKIKNFAVTARAIGTGAITPVVDTQNIKFKTGTGLNMGNKSAALSAADTATATTLKNAIEQYGILPALNDLLGTTNYTSAEMATAIVDAMASQGIDSTVISNTVNTVIDNLGGASEILNQYASASGSYKDNQTLAMADVATFGEFSLGYGQRVIPGLKLGANLKVIEGYAAQSGVMILQDNQDIGDILDKAYDNRKGSTNLGVDLGALVNFSEMLDKEIFLNPQVGLTAKNINGPKFARPDVPAELAGTPIAAQWNHDKYQLKPQVRAGVAINPMKNLTVAADLDVTENDTMISGIKSRQLGLGAEINLFNRPKFHIPLRVGYNKNLAESNVSDFFTAGVGLNMLHFYLELAGAVSADTSKVDGNTIPNSAAVSLSLGFLF